MNHSFRLALVVVALAVLSPCVRGQANLFKNGDFETRAAGNVPADYQLTGDVRYRYLGESYKDSASWGMSLQAGKPGATGEVAQVVDGIDAKAGRWFRFAFRGLPQENFVVTDDDLYMKIAFFGESGKVSYDEKAKRIYGRIEQDRRDMTVNGVRHQHGAEVWRTYTLDFYLPFPQVNQVRVSVGFGNATGAAAKSADFYVDDFSLVRIPDPPGGVAAPHTGGAIAPTGRLIPIGGRWFYDAPEGQTQVPRLFDHTNADRLIYHDNVYSAPFAGNMTAILRTGEMDLFGDVLNADRLIADNVTVRFDAGSMIIHTHGVPNHPTGKFPNFGFGDDANPNTITEQDSTYYIPLNPAVNPNHFVTTLNNSNHALPMGPIGIAVNGVVFYSPFDAGSQDATNLMDLCCGHPDQIGRYHYHKYPICVNSPWADDGEGPSPLIGWAFDGYPIYGPYVSAGVMAKDVTGDGALNGFNARYDADRGWHYHVTPGKFPYVIGGYWGTEDRRDMQRPGRGGGGMGPPGGRGGPGGPPPFGPPPF